MNKQNPKGYKVIPFPKMRRFSLDAGRLARGRHTVRGLIEVMLPRRAVIFRTTKIRLESSSRLLLLSLVVLARQSTCTKKPMRCAICGGGLVILDDVNVNMIVEIELNGKKIPMPHIIRAANRKKFREIHDEIRTTQNNPQKGRDFAFMRWFLLLPYFIRRIFYWFVIRNPRISTTYSGTVSLTAVGMFGKVTGWGITGGSFHPFGVVLGSIIEKPGVVEGEIEIREYLHVTLNFDHDVIDGVPMTRFTQKFVELIEAGYGLIE